MMDLSYCAFKILLVMKSDDKEYIVGSQDSRPLKETSRGLGLKEKMSGSFWKSRKKQRALLYW